MATVAIAVQEVVRAGLTPAYTGSLLTTNTYTFPNDGKTFMHIKKAGAGACTTTITTPGTYDGLAIAERTVIVAATTGDIMVGPFQPQVYNDGYDLVNVTFSEITGLTAGVFRLP